MPKVSAGLLLYRRGGRDVQVLLVHPGGPFWAKKDAGAWSIPKGEAQPQEDLLAVAVREVREETGFEVAAPFVPLSPVKQSGKIVHAWACEFDGDAQAIVSNTFQLEFPPRSGRFAEFPEVDKADWFDRATAHEKILKSQLPLLEEFFRLVL
ncbi:MAG TPA: NUDIX domain-containing protein [Candidatus Baltobacteraceae bacterium]|nr:NUDIX domain-containing protein [Candidatus Baltobacteraceae bacterium]